MVEAEGFDLDEDGSGEGRGRGDVVFDNEARRWTELWEEYGFHFLEVEGGDMETMEGASGQWDNGICSE